MRRVWNLDLALDPMRKGKKAYSMPHSARHQIRPQALLDEEYGNLILKKFPQFLFHIEGRGESNIR